MHFNAVLQIGPGDDPAAHHTRSDTAPRTLTLKTSPGSPIGKELPVAVLDISLQGFLIEAESNALSEGEVIDIDLPERGTVTARVMWTSNRFFGCQLDETISPGAIGAALLNVDARAAHNILAPEVPNLDFSRRAHDGKFKPALNFAIAFYLALLSWAIIGLVIYFVAG